MRRAIPCILLLSLAPCGAQQQLTENTLDLAEGATSPKATITDVSWLTGRWSGHGFGGVVEENWGLPMGGTMVATFRLVKADQPAYRASLPRYSSMRSSWLYLAVRSPRAGAPVLI